MWSINITFHGNWLICGIGIAFITVEFGWPHITFNIYLFQWSLLPIRLSDCVLLWLIWSILLIVLLGHCDVWVWCLSDEDLSLNYITLFDSAFMDYVTRLVYLVIVPDELFVSESTVCHLHFYLLPTIFDLIKLSNCSNESIWSV